MNHSGRIAAVLLLAVFSIQCVSAQNKTDKKTISRLKADIAYLASDELEGRRTGSEGERKAGDYIIQQYTRYGIPGYGGHYRYPFRFVYGKQIAPATQMTVGGDKLIPGKDAFPLPFSDDKKISGELLPDVMEQGNVWMLPLYQNEEEAQDPHFEWEKYAYEKSREAIKLGATAVVFYENYMPKYPPQFNPHSEYEKLEIPAALIHHDAYQHSIKNMGTQQTNLTIPVELNLSVTKTEQEANNIAAYIDNKARYTVVIGAHYDHLGYGDEGSSLYRGKEKMVHNGADDNASGTAALLQLASWIQKAKLSRYNYLFVHFSGEELGLLGSKAFVKQQGMDSNHFAYMINMDMVGRLNDSTHALTIGGVGTSPAWGPVISKNNPDFRIAFDSSGIGPSDHTSFYNAGIPVMFFFTGVHSDYHKPGDDAEKINYAGEALVMNYIFSVVKKMETLPKPVFTPTKNTNAGGVRFKVTLGIVPDYAYRNDDGLRVDGVSEGKPAQKAGIKAGDIITQLGEHKVNGIQSYMQALSRFKSGDRTEVTFMRGSERITAPVEFK